eukprot:15117-Eustigmatos_ZCMA.PRE.1
MSPLWAAILWVPLGRRSSPRRSKARDALPSELMCISCCLVDRRQSCSTGTLVRCCRTKGSKSV